MTLKEILATLGLTEQQVKDINSSVDVLIAGKLATQRADHTKEVGTLQAKITAFETKEAADKTASQEAIKEKLGKEIMGDSFETRKKYVKFDEDFDFTDEKAIRAKYEEVNKDFGEPKKDKTKEVEDDAFENGLRGIKTPKVVESKEDDIDPVEEELK